jgi:hypothetical protein
VAKPTDIDRAARAAGEPAVWPPPDYARQVERLRAAIGETVYTVELTFNGLSVAAVYAGEAHVLLDVADFARPDPSRGLYPHMLVFDDGRGINLGRIARVSLRTAFDPASDDVLYADRQVQQTLLYGPRRLSPKRIAAVSRLQLAAILGVPARDLLRHEPDEGRRE